MGTAKGVGQNVQLCTRKRKLDSVYRAGMRQAIAARKAGYDRRRYHALEILCDLTRAFDSVNRSKILAEGHRLSHPLALLRLSLGSYTWKRAIVIEGGIPADWRHAHQGFAPGSV